MLDPPLPPSSASTVVVRIVAWAVVAVTFVFLFNVYLTYWQDWPGAQAAARGSWLGMLQSAVYALAMIAAIGYVIGLPHRTLRFDSGLLTDLNTYLVRAAFFAVLFVGLADMAVSFLRVEGFLPQLVGSEFAHQLHFSRVRAPYIHLPLIMLALVVAAFTRTLGFTWLALLVVVAELQIVLSRFVFSYEQAFMGDLVRFWYAALFLFASAYTLLEDGHVRVDVLYAGFSRRAKGGVNAIGSVLLGILFCWVILYLGMASKSSIIIAPMLSLEVTQSGFGMYVKYMMAGFLGFFAVIMMIQFSSYLMDSFADYRGDPGGRLAAAEALHHGLPSHDTT